MKLSSKQISKLFLEKLSKASSSEEKKEVISAFATLIAKSNKTSQLQKILRIFNQKWNETYNELDVTLTTASKQNINFPKELGGKKVNLKTKEDKELIGGMKIQIENLFIDNSLIAKVRSIR